MNYLADMAITLINSLYPDDLEKVREEREFQIKLLKDIQVVHGTENG
ncbi:MAG: hypothetical protein Q4A78_10420 [Peptostreptococcaceae bacterium]|nr:hypothetical protein [Peptostreptococcaceae bacterium]